ncbi:hypothetical protein M407DRAFT_27180 [Tulasnella calospora MUT 4182]|uniref:Protein kinase domain-containing protein n=1 Tax=Tulasnella calospora MUT 4182 TaxID=1051891 RepID=A0A0C3LPN0_9AGAM|nr:hypothetical protein M407DRAFT_27180 [Tulasnella calospora MUT 4182]
MSPRVLSLVYRSLYSADSPPVTLTSNAFQKANSRPPGHLVTSFFAPTHPMQVDENHDARLLSSGSDQGDSSTPFQLSAKLIDKMNKLAEWRIAPSWIEFPENTCQFHGGHATVSRAILNLCSTESRDIDESEDSKDGHGALDNASRGKAVAVKMMKIGGANDRERVLGLALREAGLLVELDHENIVELEGFVEDLSKNKVWLVFPWEANGNLKDFAASQDWEIPERIWLIYDVASGMEYLHGRSQPIYHGDLKSINILVTSECRAVITDFGSARKLAPRDLDKQVTQTRNKAQPELEFQATFDASTNTMTLTGNEYTLRWAAPELLMDEGPDLWSDIWALGWIFYEVMTNSIPFHHVRKDSMVIKHVIDGKLPTVTDHTRMSLILRLCSLMIKCWSIDPCGRPTAEDCQRSMEWMPMVAPDAQRTSWTGASGGRSPKLLMKLGFMHYQQDDYINASNFFIEALDLYTQMGDSAGRADALYRLADLHYFRDEYSEALTLYSEVLDIRIKISDRKGRARALRGLAGVHRDQEEYSTAATFYSEASQICTDIGDRQGRAYALDGLADVYRLQDEYSKAVPLYSEVAEICADIGESDGRADALWSLADVHRVRNEYTEAVTLLSEALKIYTDTGNRYGMANTLLSLADVDRNQDHYSDAISRYDQAAKIFAHIGNNSMATDASARAARVHRKLKPVEAE